MKPYAFGDTDLAARRLEHVAEIFGESTRAFLREAVPAETGLALDLGCGPGNTTRLLAESVPRGRVVGLDSSEHFVALAEATQTERVSFLRHDVTAVPFPVGPADLVFCRFLLTHLREPQEAVARWATQLRPGGLLLIEETEWIHTANAAFATYVGMVEAMLAAQSNELYVARPLGRLPDPPALERRSNRVRAVPTTHSRAAASFALNLQAWRDRPFVQESYTRSAIEQLAHDLRSLAEDPGNEIGIEWGLRQIVFRRT